MKCITPRLARFATGINNPFAWARTFGVRICLALISLKGVSVAGHGQAGVGGTAHAALGQPPPVAVPPAARGLPRRL